MSSKFLVVALAAALAMAVGCQDKDKDAAMKSGSEKAAMMDACTHCAGTQTATADGHCPVCKMDVSAKSPAGGSSSAAPKVPAADACSHCAGTQVATAEGKCPACNAQVVQKQ